MSTPTVSFGAVFSITIDHITKDQIHLWIFIKFQKGLEEIII